MKKNNDNKLKKDSFEIIGEKKNKIIQGNGKNRNEEEIRFEK